MLHNIIYEIPLKNGLHALIDEKTPGRYVFKVIRYGPRTDELLAVANVSEHERFPQFECYIEGLKLDKPFTIEVFRPLCDFLEFHVAWFKRAIRPTATMLPFIINEEYYERFYDSRKELLMSQYAENPYE